MTAQAGSEGQHQGTPQGTDAESSFHAQISTLRKSKQDIKDNLLALYEAKLRLDLLEDNTVTIPISDPFEPGKAAGDSDPRETIRLAEYLYLITRTCRDIVKDESFNKYLNTFNYTQENATALLTAFENLADVWSTYKKIIDHLDIATWDGEPSFDRIWAALEVPRRRYIRALNVYYTQLSVVVTKLEPTPGATSNA